MTLEPREFVERYGIRSVVCCMSGGKDSLVATHYTMSELEDVDLNKYVIVVDTSVMLPSAVPFVKEICSRFGWPLKVLKPEPDFWTLAEKWGVPTRFRRWCCYRLKLKPIIQFVKALPPQRAEVLGLRKEESRKREKLPQVMLKTTRGVIRWGYCPIIDWTEKQVLAYMKEHDLPMPPHYRWGIKETCLCPVFLRKQEMMNVRARFPEIFERYLQLEERFQGKVAGGSAFYFGGKPAYARDLKKQVLFDEFVEES